MTQLLWDFTPCAPFYDKRPDYSPIVMERLLRHIAVRRGQKAADIGAGTGKLIRHLLKHGLIVTAIEPNDAMRAIGVQNTLGNPVEWVAGTAEATGLSGKQFNLVTFGSSFNVTDRLKALEETARILAALASALTDFANQPTLGVNETPAGAAGPNPQQPFATLDLAQAVLTATEQATILPTRTPMAAFP